MIPSKAKDFTAPHSGFEGELESGLYLIPGGTIKMLDNLGNLIAAYTSPTGWRLYRPPNSANWTNLQPAPLPDRNAE